MKTADEIIRGLECCQRPRCEGECPYDGVTDCGYQVQTDAAAIIRQLQAKNDSLAQFIETHGPEHHDAVNHPSHYTQGGVECIDAIKAATTGLEGIEAVCTGNAIKYLWRWKQKNGAEDLRKAEWYLNRLIAEADHGVAE